MLDIFKNDLEKSWSSPKCETVSDVKEASTLANRIIRDFPYEETPLTVSLINKIVYLVKISELGQHPREEPIVWDFGPIFESLFREGVEIGDRRRRPFVKYSEEKGEFYYKIPDFGTDSMTELFSLKEEVFNKTMKRVEKAMTGEGSPWSKVINDYNKGTLYRGRLTIPDELFQRIDQAETLWPSG